MTRTKLKTLYGVDVYIDESGEFQATIDSKFRRSNNLKRLETEIRKAFQGVRVISLIHHYGGGSDQRRDLPHNPEVEKVIRADYHTLYGPGERRLWGATYVYDEGALDVLKSVHEEYLLAKKDFDERWEKRWMGAKAELTPVDNEQLAEQLRRAAASDEG